MSGQGSARWSGAPLPRALLVGIALGAAVWLLGFLPVSPPPTTSLRLPLWVSVVPVVVAVAVWVMLRRLRRSRGSEFVVDGATVLALAAVVTVLGFTPRPAPPAGLPEPIGDQVTVSGTAAAQVSEALVFREADGTTPLVIQFPEVSAVGGYWSTRNADVTSEAFSGRVSVPGRDRAWGNTITTTDDSQVTSVTPEMRIELPLSADLDNTAITVRAAANLSYPRPEFVGFVNEDELIRREVRVIVGTPQDRSFATTLEEWRSGRLIVERFPIVLGGVALIGALRLGVGLLRPARAGSPPPWGGGSRPPSGSPPDQRTPRRGMVTTEPDRPVRAAAARHGLGEPLARFCSVRAQPLGFLLASPVPLVLLAIGWVVAGPPPPIVYVQVGVASAVLVLLGAVRSFVWRRRELWVFSSGVHARRGRQRLVARWDRITCRPTTGRDGIILAGADGGSVDLYADEWRNGREMLARIAAAAGLSV